MRCSLSWTWRMHTTVTSCRSACSPRVHTLLARRRATMPPAPLPIYLCMATWCTRTLVQGAERYRTCGHGWYCLPRAERLVRAEHADGSMAHFEGECGEERMVRAELPDGTVLHFEGIRGAEVVVMKTSTARSPWTPTSPPVSDSDRQSVTRQQSVIRQQSVSLKQPSGDQEVSAACKTSLSGAAAGGPGVSQFKEVGSLSTAVGRVTFRRARTIAGAARVFLHGAT